MVIHLNQKSYNNIQSIAGYFSTECVRSLEEHTHTHTKKKRLEINLRDLVSFHIRSQLLQMHRCYSKCVCFSLKCTAALDQVDGQVVRDYLIIFRILDSESSLKIICLEYGLGYAILSASILFCASYLVNPGLYTFREGEMGGGRTQQHRKQS